MPNQEQSEDSRFRRGLPILIFLGLLGGLLFPGLSPGGGRFANALWNLMHIPAFFIFTLALLAFWSGSGRNGYRSLMILGSALFVAMATEWIQVFFGRSGNWKDFFFNVAGIGLAFFWAGVCKRSRHPWLLFLCVAGVTLNAFLWPVLGDILAERMQKKQLPELGTFEQWETKRLWRAQGNAMATTRDGSLHVRVGEGQYGGVSFWPGKQNWTTFSYLSIRIDNPGTAFELGIRIDDETSRRPEGTWYSASAMVNSGEHTFEIQLPTGGAEISEIDFSNVTRLALFTGEEQEGREFVVKSAFLR